MSDAIDRLRAALDDDFQHYDEDTVFAPAADLAALLSERDALAAVAEPYTGRIEAFDAVLAFLTEMPDADGLVERGDLQDYVTDLRSRATAARTVAK